MFFVGESHRRKRGGNSGGEGSPGGAGVGCEKDPGAGRSRNPGLGTANGQGGEIEMPGGFGRKIAAWCMPRGAGISGEHHKSAVADQPAVDRRHESQLAKILQSGIVDAKRFDFAAAGRCRLGITAGQCPGRSE